MTKILFANKNSLIRWQTIYYRNIQQSLWVNKPKHEFGKHIFKICFIVSRLLLEYLNNNCGKRMKTLRNMDKVLNHFNEQTSAQIAQITAAAAANNESSKPYYLKKTQKSSSTAVETERLKKFNKLVQVLKCFFYLISLSFYLLRAYLIHVSIKKCDKLYNIV